MERTIKIEKKFLEISVGELIVINGKDKGKIFKLASREVLVGTSPSCEIRLSDPTVSRTHCKIFWNDEVKMFQVQDLGSTNGTLINKIPVVNAFLPPESVITLGETEMVFKQSGKKRQIELFPDENFFGCVGVSQAMREIFSIALKSAQTDLNILIEGETGVGKEELAKAIHKASPRKEKNFIVCDVTTIPKELFLTELFGYEKGAFTGADKSKKGLVELADGGTLFIDEIGEISPQDQAHLLRFVEKKELRPIGSNIIKKVDVRIISATSKNIDEEVEKGNFRSDLFFRLSQFRIKIPPLRERKEDIFPLILDTLRKLTDDEKKINMLYDFLQKNSSFILSYNWPGNVRELKNFTERFYRIWEITGEMKVDIPFMSIKNETPQDKYDFKYQKRKIIEDFERAYIIELYQRCKGNISECARLAKVNRKYMEKLIRKYIKNETSNF
jgi:DNA-binding NtrC family response regulator